MKKNPSAVGEKTEAIILAELIKRDHVVLIPFGDNHRYDFVLHLEDGSFERVQCKTAWLKNGVLIFNTKSVFTNAQGWHSKDYHGDVDAFMVYSPDLDEIYRIPIAEIGGQGNLRVEPTKNGQSKGVRWAHDYVLGDHGVSG